MLPGPGRLHIFYNSELFCAIMFLSCLSTGLDHTSLLVSCIQQAMHGWILQALLFCKFMPKCNGLFQSALICEQNQSVPFRRGNVHSESQLQQWAVPNFTPVIWKSSHLSPTKPSLSEVTRINPRRWHFQCLNRILCCCWLN